MLPGLLVATLASAGFLGVALLALGLRGRRINDHPVCRRCRFDLVGLYPRVQACPECGCALGVRTVRSGCRHRRSGMIILGAAILAIGLAGAGGVAWLRIGNFRWYEHMPVSLVVRDAKSSSPAIADRGRQELLRRIVADLLTAEACQPIIAHVLQVQSQPAEQWDPAWGDLLEMCIPRGYCSDAQLKQYVQQGVEFHAIVRPRVTVGNPGGVSLQFVQGKYGNVGLIPYRMESWVESASVAGIESERISLGVVGQHGVSDAAAQLSPSSSSWSEAELDPLPDEPGSYTVRITAGVNAQPMSVLRNGSFSDPLDEPPLTWYLVAEGQLEMVGAQAKPDLHLITDPGLREAVHGVFSVERVTRSGPGNITVAMRTARESPVDLVMQLVARCGDREIFRSSILVRKGEAPTNGAGHYGATSFRSLGIDGPVEIVLAPNPDAARRSGDLLEIWGEEIPLGTFEVEQTTTDH